MQRTILLALLLPALVQAQTPTLKTGVWETTAKSAMLPKPMLNRDCVTKADLAQLAKGPDADDDDSCKLVKAPAVSGNKWVADRKCADGRTVHLEFAAESAEKVSGTIVSTAPQGGQVFRVEIASRWVGASCAGLK